MAKLNTVAPALTAGMQTNANDLNAAAATIEARVIPNNGWAISDQSKATYNKLLREVSELLIEGAGTLAVFSTLEV